METLIKQTREVGTSAGVLLPRKWLNKQVVVTLLQPSKEEIAKEVMEIILKNNINEEIKGVYLYGSYARGDYDPYSDIDLLMITKETNKLINHGNYEVLLISEENFSKNLPDSLYYTSMLKELKTIINKDLIERYSISKYRLNVKRVLNEIGRVLKINKDTVKICEDNNKKIPDGIAYSIVLRLRELYLLKCLRSNKSYSKEDFLKICGDKNYFAYIRIKRNEKELREIIPKEMEILLDLSEKWLKELKD
ncbi:nucleotidyltransferase domain-containing protein [Candidatus Pacearchaeota archaeon]|nr:nucleotidyltransferase domain-containing protein [Candidatus Pacearchaeota archaeon]